MDTDAVWVEIHAERAGLADLVESLTAAQWDAPSLCDGWSVGDVASHATWPARFRLWPGMLDLVHHRFDQNALARADVDDRRGLGRDEIVWDLRWSATTRSKVFFLHPLDPLTDILVHGQDIAVPLGIPRHMPTAAAVAALDGLFSARSQLEFHARRRTSGVSLGATNAAWGRGSGPVAEATVEAILLFLTGRTAAVSDFQGPGAAILADRAGLHWAGRLDG